MDWDAVVVGRSYGGLSAALVLGRARKAVLVIGEGGPRNEAVLHTHGALTLDGALPSDVITRGERELERYETVQLAAERVHEITSIDGGFRVRFGAAVTTAAAIVLATGVNDSPPPVAGLSEHWGRGVFTCPFCDGFERADRPWVFVGEGADAERFAGVARNWTDNLTVLGEDEIRRVHGDGNEITAVELVDGRKLDAGAVFVAPCFQPNNQLAVALGATVDERGFVVVDEMRATSVAGLFAVGDVTGPRHQMAFAVADGVAAAASIAHRN